MPEANPHATFALVLYEHEHLDPAKSPRLVFRHPKRSDIKRLVAALESLLALTERSNLSAAEASMNALEDVLRSLLVGWGNQTDAQGRPLPFDPDRLDEVLDESQIAEVAGRVRVDPGLTSVQKKTFALQCASSLASTVAAAAPETESPDAENSAPNPGPTSSSAPRATETPPDPTTTPTTEPSAASATEAGASRSPAAPTSA